MPLTETRFLYGEVLEWSARAQQRKETEPLIETLLANILAIRLVSEFEALLADLFRRRLTTGNDTRVISFIGSISSNSLNRSKRSEIRDTLKKFGEDSEQYFLEHAAERDTQAFFNVLGQRHLTSHRELAQITLPEVLLAVDAAEQILRAVGGALDLPSPLTLPPAPPSLAS